MNLSMLRRDGANGCGWLALDEARPAAIASHAAVERILAIRANRLNHLFDRLGIASAEVVVVQMTVDDDGHLWRSAHAAARRVHLVLVRPGFGRQEERRRHCPG